MKIIAIFCTALCWSLYMAHAAIAADAVDERTQIQALHRQIIVPAADALNAAETEIPGTDRAWDDLKGIAVELQKSCEKLLALKSTDKKWAALTASMSDEALAITQAASAHNHEKFVAADAKLVTACENCHQQYRDAR